DVVDGRQGAGAFAVHLGQRLDLDCGWPIAHLQIHLQHARIALSTMPTTKAYNVDKTSTRPSAKGGASAKTRRGELSRGRILATALELVDQDGLEALTMRRLAEQLKVDPMSLYNYVDGKDALLDGLAEQLWSEVPLPDRAKGWKSVLRAYAISIRDIA